MLDDPSVTLLTYDDLRKLGYGSRTTVWRKVRRGRFPKPIDFNGQPRWTLAMIRALVESAA